MDKPHPQPVPRVLDVFRDMVREYRASERPTAADCQALLGAMALAERLGVDAAELRAVIAPEELGTSIAHLLRGPVQ